MLFRKYSNSNKPGHHRHTDAPTLAGLHYHKALSKLHETREPLWYLEIGSRNGTSLELVRNNFIAIDPVFELRNTPSFGGEQALYFQIPSDDFFGSGFLEKNSILPDLAFIDGMHLFDYVIRDFANCEKAMPPDGMICLHDVCPFNTEQTTRDLRYMTENGYPWTGDVWKAIAILKKYRPDLQIDVLDCSSTGLACITHLDPGNDTLALQYDRIVTDWLDVDLETYGLARYYDEISLQSAERFLEA